MKHYVIAILNIINPALRHTFGDRFSIPEELRFDDWREVLDKPLLADAVFICTQDKQHRDPAVALADKGYHK